jgi:hypothetical protein
MSIKLSIGVFKSEMYFCVHDWWEKFETAVMMKYGVDNFNKSKQTELKTYGAKLVKFDSHPVFNAHLEFETEDQLTLFLLTWS